MGERLTPIRLHEALACIGALEEENEIRKTQLANNAKLQDRRLAKRDARIKELAAERDAARTKGYREGVTAYAWWKDGVQYVGTCGDTLAAALAGKGDEDEL